MNSERFGTTRHSAWGAVLAWVIGWMALPAAAQDGELVWAQSMGGTGSDRGVGITVDAAGNVYTTGSFAGTANFDPGPDSFNLTAAGGSDIFVQKLDSGGNFVWARSMGGTDSDIGEAIAVDAAGNVYTTGLFRNTVDFDPGPGTFSLTSAGDRDIFVQKLDNDGNFVWARSMGGEEIGHGVGIAVDAAGNVYTTGRFAGTADFDPGPGSFTLTAAGGTDIFVQKLDADGNFVWARSMGGSGVDVGLDIAVDAAGNVYSTGWFAGTAIFDPFNGSFNLTAAGGSDIFVQKLDSDGNFVWTRSVGGAGDDGGLGIAVDAEGNVYTTGFFEGTADFDPGPATFTLTAAGGDDIFVQKLDSDGNFVWTRSVGGAGDDGGLGIAVDAEGNVYTTGFFEGTADFDPGPDAFPLTSEGGDDTFVLKLDNNGDFVWARSMGGTGVDQGFGIAVDGAGSVYATGMFSGTADFDPGPGTLTLTSAGNDDIFVVKLSGPLIPGPGDVNGDGVVNAQDVQLVVNAALGIAIAFDADVNGDGVVNAQDVQLVINAALGLDISGQVP